MKKIYIKNQDAHVNILLLKTGFDSVDDLRKSYPTFFNSSAIILHSSDYLEKVLHGESVFLEDKTNVVLMGNKFISAHQINDYCRRLYDLGYKQCMCRDSLVFNIFEIKDLSLIGMCQCDSLELFRFGCKCGGK